MKTSVAGFIQLAELGIPLIPIHPETATPLWKGWQERATSDLARVQEWAMRFPALAVATGMHCDIYDIEVDHIERLRPLIQAHSGPIARSARGGLHLYVKPTKRGCPRLLHEGVHVGEMKGKGGACTVPPSVRPKGAYAWLRAPWDTELTEATGELLALLPTSKPRIAVRTAPGPLTGMWRLQALAEAVAAAERGNRNNLLYWATCRAIEEGIPVRAVRRSLLLAAADAGLDRQEAAGTIESGVHHAKV